LLVINYELY